MELAALTRELPDGRRGRLAVGLGVLLVAIVPFTTTAFVTEIVFTGLVFVMLGVSWNLLAGYAGQISLGHAAFFGLGAFVSAWVTTPAPANFPGWMQLPMSLSLVAATVAAGVLALAIGPIIFRLTGHYFAVGTLALSAIIQLLLLDARSISGGSTGYYVTESFGDTAIFLLGLVVTIAMVVVTARIVDSPLGLGMRAVHGDEQAADSLGVYPLKYKIYAFVISAAMAGLAGGLYAQFTLFISPDSTLSLVWMIDTLVVVVLGGMGTILGPILGAVVFVGLDNGLQQVLGGNFATTAEGLLIILIIIYAPDGIYGVIDDRFRSRGDGSSPAADDQTGVEGVAPDRSE